MSNYGADPSPDLDQIQWLARLYNMQPADLLKADQYTYAPDQRTFHLVEKRTNSSLWISTDPTQLPTST